MEPVAIEVAGYTVRAWDVLKKAEMSPILREITDELERLRIDMGNIDELMKTYWGRSLIEAILTPFLPRYLSSYLEISREEAERIPRASQYELFFATRNVNQQTVDALTRMATGGEEVR